MLDKLIEVCLEFLDLFRFWEIVDPYESGIVLRLGAYHRTLTNTNGIKWRRSDEEGTGLHWVWPFGIERVLSENIVPTTFNLGPQSLITKDGKPVVVSAIVTREVRNVRKSLLEVDNVNTVIIDSTYGTLGRLVRAADFDQLHTQEFEDEMTKEVRKRTQPFGIYVSRVQFSDFTTGRSMRLWMETNQASVVPFAMR